jgi:hypothetical protein
MNVSRLFIGLIGTVFAAAAAEAQVPAPPAGGHTEVRRPHDSLFDTGGTDGGERGALVLELSGYGGHDDDVISQESVGRPQLGLPGQFVGGRAAIDYARAGRKVSFAFGGDSTFRYLAIPQSDTIGDGTVSAALAAQLSRNWQLHAEQQVGYTSFFLFSPLPAVSALAPNGTAGVDFAVARRPAYTTGTQLSTTRTVGRRSSLSVEFSGRSTALVDNRDQFLDYGAGAKYEHPVSRNATLHLGYGYRQSSNRMTADDEQIGMHDVDAGVRYAGRPSFSRRTHLAFSTGSVVIHRGPTVPDRTFIQLVGSATASYDAGRTWSIHAAYDRGAQFVHVIPGVFSSNAASAGATGDLGRRLELSLNASYSTGTLSFQVYDDPLTTYQGEARLRTALSRSLAVDISYLHYHYAFDGHGAGAELERDVRRNSVRAGVTLRLSSAAKRNRP